jgi:cytochrome c peroxidase
MTLRKKLLFLLTTSLLAVSCKRDADVIEVKENIKLVIPAGWPQPVYVFDLENNPLTNEGFELGRKLFYDPILSKDNTISCGSCHQQFAAFSHLDHAVSHGINSLNGTRNAPALQNLIWLPDLMWDGGVNHLEIQPTAAITNPVEMDETIANVVSKLQNHAEYPALFKNVFGTDVVTSQLLLRAIAQFSGMLNSYQSKYDDYVAGKATFTPQELNGLNLVRKKCTSCHTEPLFTNFSFKNNGLDQTFADSGRAKITNDPNDMAKFKVPSLRNVVLSYPYMHDGRFNSLGQVLDHYANGINQSATLDSSLVAGISLTTSEKQDIISFLNTLSDSKFITDKRFSEKQ